MSDRTKRAPHDPAQDVVLARRKLLSIVAYVAPAVVSTLAVRHASAQPAPSCGPATCRPSGGGPCGPGGTCGPDNPCGPDNCRPAR